MAAGTKRYFPGHDQTTEMITNIHPVFNRMLSREERQRVHHQQSRALWFTGLSGSGKSTIAIALERRLYADGFKAQVLDGDNIRSGLNSNLGFSDADREENIRRIAEVSKLFVHAGIITLNSFISPTASIRAHARQIIGNTDFLEIYVNAPIEICEQRDVKGLYAKARRGEIHNFTGIDAPYEVPDQPFLEVRTEDKSVEECVDYIFENIKSEIQLK